MHLSFFRCWPAFLLAGLAVTAAAQTTPPATAAAMPQDGWRSAFEGYRPFNDAPVASWRQSNDTVGRVGGWRAYAREAAQPASPLPASPVPATGAAPAPGKAPAPAAAGHQH